jgi:hypothetical protein
MAYLKLSPNEMYETGVAKAGLLRLPAAPESDNRRYARFLGSEEIDHCRFRKGCSARHGVRLPGCCCLSR